MNAADGVNGTPPPSVRSGAGTDGRSNDGTSNADQRQATPDPGQAAPGSGVAIDYEGHEARTTHQAAGQLRPAQVKPYCGLCRVPWPCPKAAAKQGNQPTAVVPPPAALPLTATGQRCTACGLAWPCPTAQRRSGVLDRHGSEHRPEVTT